MICLKFMKITIVTNEIISYRIIKEKAEEDTTETPGDTFKF